MDATSVIIESHAELERAFDAFDRAEGSHRRQIRALRSVAGGLAVHATVEEEVLYPAIRELTGRHDRRLERQLEHGHLLELLPQLRRRLEREDRVQLGKELLERMHQLQGAPER